MSSIDLKDQLLYLKGMTERLGCIHEAQLLQLRNYPLLIPSVKTVKMSLDVEAKYLKYECETEEKKFRKSKKNMVWFENITKWVQTVIWDKTIVDINIDGKCVYDSRTVTTSK